ncbi:putative 50.9 kDa protein in ND4 intron 1 [Erysiphe neolycopersici]|uniref:Putative 50.9 kDa protein in ND4 intron 1 n=1 Tax=Erysiphe neolycopersici TaxID=212602 RepID=A0A420HY93_9PEZI|nr:putative 50.9 kDa protein in ND4 intron 1 [Erysiphe neolycopersici]
MLLLMLLLTPLLGIFFITISRYYALKLEKIIALITTIINTIFSLVIFILFDFSINEFLFVQEYHNLSSYDLYLGIDGISIYFVLLTTIISPIALLNENVLSFVIIILILESLLLAVFLVLDLLMFYIFFESILPPLFILIGLYGSNNKVRASFYLFLYTLTKQCKITKHRENPKALVTKVVR